MRKLSAQDAMFLYSETPATPMHVGSVQYLEVREDRRDRFFDDFRTMLLERIHLVPYLTSRLEHTPMDIDHPVWVRHAAFDIDQHLHRVELPEPADQATLEQLVAELYEPLMDRRKPLWEMWVIEGLANGQVALLQKTHHAAIDGMSSIKAAELLFDFSDEPRAVEPAPDGFWDEDRPSTANLIAAALRNLNRYWWESMDRLPSTLQAINALNGQLLSGARKPLAMNAAKTRFNGSIDGRRAFATVEMSLPRTKAAAKAAGVKLNDVMLAITGDGLARYLAAHGEAPTAPLLVNCPVSLHRPGDQSIGNQVGAINVSACNDVAEPKARLEAIHAAANNAKSTLADLRDAMVTDFGGFGMPALWQRLSQADGKGLAADLAPQVPTNLVLSNVPGFQIPLYVAGARLISQMPMSIVVHGSAVNLTVTSYVDRLDLGITVATRRIPDVELLRAKLEEAYEALLAALLDEEAAAAPEAPLAQAA